MLNPSAGTELPSNYLAQNYGRLFEHTRKAGVGVIGIRVLAGGALSGSTERHPIASPPPEPIGSALSYEADVKRARRLMPIVQEGFAASLTEAATRFAISHPAIGTILVTFSGEPR
jgi:aryl-alcohol dehydrogenase-like predicted oxidoreductase